MSEAKVPYCKRIRDTEIRFLNRLEKFVYERTSPYVIDKQVELINRAHEDGVKVGRASRDGLRSQLRSNNTVLFDVASLVGAGKYFDAIELCHAKVFGNNQALEDDGEGR